MVVKTYTFIGKSANCDLTSSGHVKIRDRTAAVHNSAP